MAQDNERELNAIINEPSYDAKVENKENVSDFVPAPEFEPSYQSENEMYEANGAQEFGELKVKNNEIEEELSCAKSSIESLIRRGHMLR